MPDTYSLYLQNFRSIRSATVEIAPLTVVYGANGSGKSSLIYGLLTLKNFLTNPGQNLPSLFSYPFISLGGWRDVVHRHTATTPMTLSIGVAGPDDLSSTFSLNLRESDGQASMSFEGPKDDPNPSFPEGLDLEISIPYGANQQVDRPFVVDQGPGMPEASGIVVWNGIAVSTHIRDATGQATGTIEQFNHRANLPMELARQTGFVPLRRGFSKPSHGLAGVTSALATEDEVATLLGAHDERYRRYEVSSYMEKIADRRIEASSQPGTSTFTIDSIPTGPTGSRVPASIVNEGFGINQLLYMLTICLYSPFKIVAIEEPEIHLHPSMVRKLARELVKIATNEDRRLIVSTHSEVFVTALLAQIAAGDVNVDDVSFVLAENEDGESTFTPQKATSDGRISGGLQAFMASEVEDLAVLLGLGDQRGQ